MYLDQRARQSLFYASHISRDIIPHIVMALNLDNCEHRNLFCKLTQYSLNQNRFNLQQAQTFLLHEKLELIPMLN